MTGHEPMDDSATPVHRMAELFEETREFLAQLRQEDIKTLKDSLRLVTAIQTVGSFIKWLIVGILGIAVGIVMFGESVAKILMWFRHAA